MRRMRLPAPAQAVDEHRGQRDLAKVPRVGLVVEARDDLFEAIEHGDGVADRIGHRPAGQQQVLGNAWPEAIEDREVRSPEVGAAGEAADEQQQVHGCCDILVRRIELVALSLDRSHQQPVDRAQVAIAVEQHEGGGRDRLQRGAGPGLGFQRLGDDLLAVAQASRHVRADERRLGQPAAAVDVDRAELRRARQRGHRADRVATTQHLPSVGLEHRRNPLIRLDARLGQMPRLPLRLVCPHTGQDAMCFATLSCRR